MQVYIYKLYIYMCSHNNICMYKHTYTHVNVYTHMHTSIHTQIQHVHSHILTGTHRAWYWANCIHTKRQSHSQINTHLKSCTHAHIVTHKLWCGPTAYVQKFKPTYIHTHKYAHICTPHTDVPSSYKHTALRGALDCNRYDHRDF